MTPKPKEPEWEVTRYKQPVTPRINKEFYYYCLRMTVDNLEEFYEDSPANVLVFRVEADAECVRVRLNANLNIVFSEWRAQHYPQERDRYAISMEITKHGYYQRGELWRDKSGEVPVFKSYDLAQNQAWLLNEAESDKEPSK